MKEADRMPVVPADTEPAPDNEGGQFSPICSDDTFATASTDWEAGAFRLFSDD